LRKTTTPTPEPIGISIPSADGKTLGRNWCRLPAAGASQTLFRARATKVGPPSHRASALASNKIHNSHAIEANQKHLTMWVSGHSK
jgi:hypothetical protein